MRKIFLLFWAFLATTCLWAHDFVVDGIYYNYLDGSNVEVTYRGYDDYIYDEYSGEVIIPSTVPYNGITYSVTSIGNSAFSGCKSLTSITIPNSVTSIGGYAFQSCSSLTSLTSITIPNGVKSIGEYTFDNCSSLTSVTIGNSVTSIGDYAFRDCSSLTSVNIPNSVTSIGRYAFQFCSSLTSVTIGNSVTSIRKSVFYNCYSLTSITIPNSVTSIGDYAFSSCSSLTSIIIPNSVESIGGWAFEDCSSLTSVTIGNSVEIIEGWAFEDCSSLTSITCEAETPPTIGSNNFDGVSKSIPVYVPCGSENAYKAAYGWNDFTNIQGPLAEYSIQVSTSNSQMGTAMVDYNTACGNQISATANYGYHFVRWSDGNTDNPRSLGLTQDTVLTAEFAPNKYTITTVSSYTQRGTTKGDTTVNYLEYITISATANYGYHFSHWNGYNYDNPRQVQVTENKTYTAYFDKNTYYITKNYNSNQGYVNGSSSGEYLDNITLTAEPNYGYHFLQWSDGVTDNPRTITLTQDTILTAEFAQSFSGQCGDNLYWSYNESDQTISITGSGKMYDYTASTQPWLLFKEEIKEVVIANTATSIGTSAFEGCLRLGKVSLGAAMENVAATAFAGCNRLYDVYCYATCPPFADESSFANYNVYLYVPCENQRDYILDIVWGKFKFIECLGADEVEDTEDVEIDAGSTDVTITWPTEESADTYAIVIRKDGQVVCTLTFNADGQLLNIAFAPGCDSNHAAQCAEAVANGGFRFTVTGLEEGTDYDYTITTKDTNGNTIATYSGEFTTQSTTAVENISSAEANCQKLLRDGQFLILRDGKTYTITGQRF